MRVKMGIDVERSADGYWSASCGTVVAVRRTKDEAISAVRQAVHERLLADPRMPRVVPAPHHGRIWVVVPDMDGGTITLSIDTDTGRVVGTTCSGHGLDAEVAVWRQHAETLGVGG